MQQNKKLAIKVLRITCGILSMGFLKNCQYIERSVMLTPLKN